MSWAVLHGPDEEANWADREFDERADADDLKDELDGFCPNCSHLVVWVD